MSLLRAGLWLSAGVSLGRIAGFVREAIIARTYGLGVEADVATVVLTLPDSLLNVLVGSAMAAAVVPALALARTAGGQAAVDRLQTQVAVLAGMLGFLFAGLLTAGAPQVIHLIAPGLAEPAVVRAAELIGIAVWAIPLTVLSSVVGAGLQERERFAATSLGTLGFNGAIILGLLIWQGALPALAWAMLAGAGVRLAGQLWEWRLVCGGWRWGAWLPTRGMAVAYAQVLLAGAALMLLPLAGRFFASFSGPGAMAAYTYATKLFELPLQVLVTVFAMALFPRFTRLLATGDAAGARRFLGLGSQVVLVAAVSAAVVGIWFAPDLVLVAFHLEDPRVAELTRWLLPGLPLAGLTALLQAWYAAQQDTRTPLVAGLIGVACYFAAGWPVVQVWGLPGIAALATFQQVIVVGILLIRQRPGGWPWPALAAGAAAILVCLLSPLIDAPIVRLALAVLAGTVALAAGLACIPGLRTALKR